MKELNLKVNNSWLVARVFFFFKLIIKITIDQYPSEVHAKFSFLLNAHLEEQRCFAFVL